jgi:hypothetical protein
VLLLGYGRATQRMPTGENHSAGHLVNRVEIEQIASGHETHHFEAEAEFENGPPSFLVIIIDRRGGRVFRNLGKHFQHQR